MRKLLIILLLITVAALGYLAYAHYSGGKVPTLGLPIGGERAHIDLALNPSLNRSSLRTPAH